MLAFITVAEAGSFSVAAEKLHLTQPAISKRISTLETSLQASLFDRIGRRIQLTEAGVLLLPRARKILLDVRDTATSIRNLSAGVSGRLSMASSHHIGLHRLPPVLKEYTKRFPQVSIDISFLDSEEAYQQVIHGDIELAVVTLSLQDVDRIERRVLWSDTLSFMASRDHPLARQGEIGLKQLLGYPSILPSENTFTRQLVEKLFSDRRMKLEVEMSTNYLETIRMMVSIGMAWSVLPDTMLDDTLIALPVRNVTLNRELGYIYHRDHTLSNAATAFIEGLEQKKFRV